MNFWIWIYLPVIIARLSAWARRAACLFENPVVVRPTASSWASSAHLSIRWFSYLCGRRCFAGLPHFLIIILSRSGAVIAIALIGILASGDVLQDFALSFNNQRFVPREPRSWLPQHSVCSSRSGRHQSFHFHLLFSYSADSRVDLLFFKPQTTTAILLRISNSLWYNFRISLSRGPSSSFAFHSFGTQVF